MDAPTFRTDFPEFSDRTKYPDAQITFWLNVASLSLSANVWGALLPYGTELYVAHNLVLSAQNQDAANRGRIGGTSGSGIISSKTLDKASISYDTKSTLLAGGGAWNATTYGVRFWQLASQFGAGGIQINGPINYDGGLDYNADIVYPYWAGYTYGH